MEPIDSAMHTDMAEADVMPTEKMFEVLDDFAEMGVKAVTYSGGGEPLLHKDIVGIMQHTLNLGLDLSIITNGQMLKGERARVLRYAKWVRVSMDYTNGPEMARTRIVPERLFEDVLNNLREFAKLKHAGCDLGVNFIIHRGNSGFETNEPDKLVKFALTLRDCGVENVRLSPMWTPNLAEYHAPHRAMVEAQLRAVSQIIRDRQPFSVTSTFNLESAAHGVERGYTKCPFMQVVPVVGADQKVYACHNKAYDASGCIGSIELMRFKELWFSAEAQEKFRMLNPQTDCRHQCANDSKNILIHRLLEAHADNFV